MARDSTNSAGDDLSDGARANWGPLTSGRAACTVKIVLFLDASGAVLEDAIRAGFREPRQDLGEGPGGRGLDVHVHDSDAPSGMTPYLLAVAH